MSDESWDEQFKRFLRKTGEDVRRTSAEITAEAQRLVEAAMDPEKQQQVRDRLGELGVWARKTAHNVAGAVEGAASKAESAFHRATGKGDEEKASGSQPPARRAKPGRTAATKGRTKAAKPGKKGATRRKR